MFANVILACVNNLNLFIYCQSFMFHISLPQVYSLLPQFFNPIAESFDRRMEMFSPIGQYEFKLEHKHIHTHMSFVVLRECFFHVRF